MKIKNDCTKVIKQMFFEFVEIKLIMNLLIFTKNIQQIIWKDKFHSFAIFCSYSRYIHTKKNIMYNLCNSDVSHTHEEMNCHGGIEHNDCI
jgi:hypothetical protein